VANDKWNYIDGGAVAIARAKIPKKRQNERRFASSAGLLYEQDLPFHNGNLKETSPPRPGNPPLTPE